MLIETKAGDYGEDRIVRRRTGKGEEGNYKSSLLITIILTDSR